MIYPFALLTAWGLASPRWRRVFVAACATALLTFLVYLPVLFVSGLDALTNNPWVRPLPWRLFFAALPHAARDVWKSWTAAIPLALALVLAALFVAGALRGRVTFWFALPAVAGLLLLQHTIPFPRTWLPLLVLVIVTMSAALPSRFELVTALILGVLLAACTLTIPRRPETGELPHVLEVVQFLKVNARPTDAIGTLSPSDVPLAFYLHDARPLRPDVSAPRIWVVTSDGIGQVLPKTLYELNIDPRLFTFAKRASFGEVGIYKFDRR
jgi:cell shape-determining protein MreD